MEPEEVPIQDIKESKPDALALLKRSARQRKKKKKDRKRNPRSKKSLLPRLRKDEQYDVKPDGKPTGPPRFCYANDASKNLPQEFCDNVIITYRYNLLTFLPLFLFTQFKRVANIYFLIISILQLIPGLSPTGQFTTLLVLIFVLAINGVKEAYEDYKRHRDDKQVNNRSVRAIRQGQLVEMAWWQVQVGDIVLLHHKEPIPADCVVLATSEEQGVVYVETSSLDGETNLKRRQAVLESQQQLGSFEELVQWKGFVRAEYPHRFISSFSGQLSLSGDPDDLMPLKEEQMLLRGSTVRNTKQCWALVVYTGDDTKLVMNSKRPPFKRTLVERKTNIYIFAVFLLLLAVSIGCAIGSGVYINLNRDAAYLDQADANATSAAAINFLTFFILFGQMIPISLYTSMEIVRLLQGWFMQQDLNMYDAKSDTPMAARSTTLNEELGQIGMIFSDKTGTLTQNQMQFRKCVIQGETYGRGYTEIGLLNAQRRGEPIDETMVSKDEELEDIFVNFDDDRMMQRLEEEKGDGPVTDFLMTLALCHTVVPEQDEDGKLEYQASSPDEMALVCAARQLGFFFSARKGRGMTVTLKNGDEQLWEVLQVLEFDSDRKRMSVIARGPDEKVWLLCKGADSVIRKRVADGQQGLEATEKSLERLGSEGLRTLMVARRELDPSFYKQWAERYTEASRMVEHRKEALDALSDEIENDLELVGATAIEDKLQEGVPDAIEMLARAGISIYVLTGDKQETAINIGYACSLLDESMNKMILNADPDVEDDQEGKKSTEAQMDQFLRETEGAADGNEKLALVVNGFTLRFALDDEFGLVEKFVELSRRCKSIICCRVSPAQKAQVVKLHKTRLQKITLAIGDGANDVSMIQAAHVGIGISGEEGLQAVRSADYAIAQFRFLVPLLLVHGRYSYRRMTKLLMYFFYKNVFLVLTQLWYTIFNSFTGQSLFEEWTLALYNVVFTSIPVVVFAVLDADVSRKTVLRNPGLYKSGQKNELFTLPIFLRWVLNGVYMSAAVYFMVHFTYQDDRMAIHGDSLGLWVFGWYVFTGLVLTVNLRLALEVKLWVWPQHLAIWLSILSVYLWGAIYSPVYPGLRLGYNMYWVFYRAVAEPSYWISVFLGIVVSLLPSFTYTYIQRTYFPSDYHIIQEQESLLGVTMPEEEKPASAKFAPQPQPHKYTGYAFGAGDEQRLKRATQQTSEPVDFRPGEGNARRSRAVVDEPFRDPRNVVSEVALVNSDVTNNPTLSNL